MTDERIAQLRKAAKLIRGTECDGWGALLLEALTEIDRLRAALAEREARIAELEEALRDSMSQCGEQCFSHDGYRCDCGSDEHNNRIVAALSRKGTP